MTKYGPQHEREQRRAEKAALKEAVRADAERWVPPTAEECGGDEELDVPVTETTRLVLRYRWHEGRLVDFAIMHYMYVRQVWQKVCRVDCAHGNIHQHLFTRTGDSDERVVQLHPIHSETDVAAHYDDAYALVSDNIDDNERRWHQ